MILLPGLAREGLELLREAFEHTEAPPESPALPSAFGAWQYGKSMAPEDALRWLRLGVRLMQARGRFKAEHHVAGAELAGLAIVEFKRFHELEIAPILEAGRIAIEAHRKAQESKAPQQAAIAERNAEICKAAIKRRDENKNRVSTIQFLMTEYNLSDSSVRIILQEGGVRWRKAR
jgi:hypothetical protein